MQHSVTFLKGPFRNVCPCLSNILCTSLSVIILTGSRERRRRKLLWCELWCRAWTLWTVTYSLPGQVCVCCVMSCHGDCWARDWVQDFLHNARLCTHGMRRNSPLMARLFWEAGEVRSAPLTALSRVCYSQSSLILKNKHNIASDKDAARSDPFSTGPF